MDYYSRSFVAALVVVALLVQACAPGAVATVRHDSAVEPPASVPEPSAQERDGWGPHFEPDLLSDVTGINQEGRSVHHPRGFVLHRVDVEETLTMRRVCTVEMAANARCEARASEAEQRALVAEDKVVFWSIFSGVLGLFCGAGFVIVVSYGVNP